MSLHYKAAAVIAVIKVTFNKFFPTAEENCKLCSHSVVEQSWSLQR